MIKKLIVPGIIGLIMFALAFGGAFFLHGYWQGSEERAIKETNEASLSSLQQQGKLDAMSARFVAVVPTGQEETEDEMPAGPIAIVPGAIRYELDAKAIKPKDIAWDDEEKMLTVKLPALSLTGPVIDYEDARQILTGGRVVRMPGAEAQLNQHDRITAQVTLLEQAKADAPMRQAKDVVRKTVEHAFAQPLKDAGIKAKVEVLFPDEIKKDEGEGSGEDEEQES